jgi:5'-phosphate synthase pdxT subunit
MKVGVLALQGAFAEHLSALNQLDVDGRPVRFPKDLEGIDGLIIPGGESTTIGKLLAITGLDGAVKERCESGMPVWGTCAGMIVLSNDLGDSGSRTGAPQPLLNLIDIRVRRNAFGSQLDSFETTLNAPAVADYPIPAIFIRAPLIEAAGPKVAILARLPDDRPVAARSDNILVTSFHPELGNDLAFHRYFLAIIDGPRI